MDDHNSIDVKIEDSRTETHYLGLIPICVLVIIIFVRVTFVLCKSYGKCLHFRLFLYTYDFFGQRPLSNMLVMKNTCFSNRYIFLPQSH